jgi:hypothetical protein
MAAAKRSRPTGFISFLSTLKFALRPELATAIFFIFARQIHPLHGFDIELPAYHLGILKAPTAGCVSGLFSTLVWLDDVSADVSAGRRSRAATECFIPAHPGATVVADLDDHADRMMRRLEFHCLC